MVENLQTQEFRLYWQAENQKSFNFTFSEPVLSYKNVTENCDEQKEFCQTFYR